LKRSLALLQIAGLAACSTSSIDHPAPVFEPVPASWQQSDEWQFIVTDGNQQALGYLRLNLTDRPLESEDCDVSGWYRADVIENKLDYELAAELAPGYSIKGPWITVDLTATTCNIGYKMVGTITNDGAAGHFNFVHSLGGENVGKFRARPADTLRNGDDQQAFSIEN